MDKKNHYECVSCPLREKYEQNPTSLLGRFWRWHIDFCPGWREYFNSLPQSEKEQIRIQYNFNKYH